MNNAPRRTIAVIALLTALLLVTISGGFITYASFTDGGSVEVTYTTGDLSEDEETSEDE